MVTPNSIFLELSTSFLAVIVIKWGIMGSSGGKWELLKNVPIFIPRS